MKVTIQSRDGKIGRAVQAGQRPVGKKCKVGSPFQSANPH